MSWWVWGQGVFNFGVGESPVKLLCRGICMSAPPLFFLGLFRDLGEVISPINYFCSLLIRFLALLLLLESSILGLLKRGHSRSINGSLNC